MAQQSSKQAGGIKKGVEFFHESVDELKKVTYPTRQETTQATIVVAIMMVIISAYLGLLDLVFNRLMESLLS